MLCRDQRRYGSDHRKIISHSNPFLKSLFENPQTIENQIIKLSACSSSGHLQGRNADLINPCRSKLSHPANPTNPINPGIKWGRRGGRNKLLPRETDFSRSTVCEGKMNFLTRLKTCPYEWLLGLGRGETSKIFGYSPACLNTAWNKCS